jgi:hypothetical protein
MSNYLPTNIAHNGVSLNVNAVAPEFLANRAVHNFRWDKNFEFSARQETDVIVGNSESLINDRILQDLSSFAN